MEGATSPGTQPELHSSSDRDICGEMSSYTPGRAISGFAGGAANHIMSATSNPSPEPELTSRALPDLPGLLESLLFVAPEPVKVEILAIAVEKASEEVEEALSALAESYRNRGLRVQHDRGRVQLVTAPETATYVERFLGLDLTSRLSSAALETLAIIAYRQPVTRAQINELRGVNSDGVLRTLLHWSLIEQGERLEQAGRPYTFSTTFDFLQYFGLQGLDELPAMEEEEMESHSPGVGD